MGHYKENLKTVIAESMEKVLQGVDSVEAQAEHLVSNVLNVIKDDPKMVATTLYFVGSTPEEAMETNEFDSIEEAKSYAIDQEEEVNIYSAGAIINFHQMGLVD